MVYGLSVSAIATTIAVKRGGTSPGPDINAQDFGKLFTDVACREQVFVMTMLLGGYFVRPPSRVNRVVIAATEADAESNETTFPSVVAQFLASDLNLTDNDVDKDGKLSLFDLYVVVAKEISQNYASAEQLATEHPQLDDDGDGVGHEVQYPFLPEELGGSKGKKKLVKSHHDGSLAARRLCSAADTQKKECRLTVLRWNCRRLASPSSAMP